MDRFDMVKNFHIAFGHPSPEVPQMLSRGETTEDIAINERFSYEIQLLSRRMKELGKSNKGGQMLKRMSWALEEIAETMTATTLEDQVDGILDKIYFAYGDLVEMGVNPSYLFEIVNNANMSKLWEDGKPRKDEQGKFIKPPSWVAPEPKIRNELKRQILRAQNKSGL